jgi:hypothetical protein
VDNNRAVTFHDKDAPPVIRESIEQYAAQMPESPVQAQPEVSAPPPSTSVESLLEASKGDNFNIYQLKDGTETRDYRFRSLSDLKQSGLKVDLNNYKLVYAAPLAKKCTLNNIYEQFNSDNRPSDFIGHSLSVSDVIVAQKGDMMRSYYVDDVGFKQIRTFTGQEQPPQPEAVQREQAKPPSAPPQTEASPAVKNKKPSSILARLETNKKIVAQQEAANNNSLKKNAERG